MKLRCGDVTLRIGGSLGAPSSSVHAVARRAKLVASRRLRMAADAIQQGRGQVSSVRYQIMKRSRSCWLAQDSAQRAASKLAKAQLDLPANRKLCPHAWLIDQPLESH